jgi:2-haloacid dehalogenase
MLRYYKPAPENYHKALGLLKLTPDECVTVAAHMSDLKGVKNVGMKTLYVRRWTDDIKEDQERERCVSRGYAGAGRRNFELVISKK